MQLSNVNKKIRKINGALSSDGQKAIIMPADIADRLIKSGDASTAIKPAK